MECILPFKWDVKTIFHTHPVPRSRETSKAYICPQLRDGGAGGELAEVHHCPAQKQEQWKPCPGEDQAYSRDKYSTDVCRMENGTYHYPLIWDNGTLVKRHLRFGPSGSSFIAYHSCANRNGERQWRLPILGPGMQHHLQEVHVPWFRDHYQWRMIEASDGKFTNHGS